MPDELTTSETNFYLGVVFELGGQEVALEPLTPINNVSLYGLECQLERPVDLKRLGDRLKDVLEVVGADPEIIFEPDSNEIKPDIKDLPVVGEVVETILEANVVIEQFHIYIPPTPKTPTEVKPPVRYTLGMSASWGQEVTKDGKKTGHLFGEVYLKGLYLKVSNEEALLPASENSTPTEGETQ